MWTHPISCVMVGDMGVLVRGILEYLNGVLGEHSCIFLSGTLFFLGCRVNKGLKTNKQTNRDRLSGSCPNEVDCSWKQSTALFSECLVFSCASVIEVHYSFTSPFILQTSASEPMYIPFFESGALLAVGLVTPPKAQTRYHFIENLLWSSKIGLVIFLRYSHWPYSHQSSMTLGYWIEDTGLLTCLHSQPGKTDICLGFSWW